MQSFSSSRTTNPAFVVVDNDKIGGVNSSVGGRKSEDVVAVVKPDLVGLDSDEWSSEVEDKKELFHGDDVDGVEEEDSDEEEEDDDDDDEDEWEEFVSERRMILEDAKQLSKLADFFAHPDKSVAVDGFAAGRNYYSRASAEEQEDEDMEDEREQILAEALALKKTAVVYAHPEAPLEVDATATAGNYFSQPWATPQETFGAAEERALAIQQAKTMANAVAVYQHPETPLEVDSTAFGRNYYSRASAEEAIVDDEDYEEERETILEELAQLKQLAVAYQHPEAPLQVDSTCFGRNYFGRASAVDKESFAAAEERALAIAQTSALKEQVVLYRHPERPLEIDSAALGRNYFSRASAPEQEEDEYADDREIILEEMKELKEAAVTYRHPEKPLEMDATATARGYFDRASAEEQDADEETAERAAILREMKALKSLAVTYRHPELPLEVDAAATARNYFTRASAPEQEDDEYSDDREIILDEMKELKEAAVLYRHPEKPLEVGATAMARGYFSRPSAEEQDEEDETAERAAILREMKALKSLAITYRHPEMPLEVDATATARNYFSRPSALEQEEEDVDEERQAILEEMALMKKQASTYMHPEAPLVVDATCFGRNYFGRASAVDKETFGAAEERALAIAEAAALKEQAVLYAHPEKPLGVDATAFGRNYFGRASAEDDESVDEEERALVLEEMAQLKKLAVDYMHPERPVVISQDPCAFGRNYFGRASAPEQDDEDLDDEREAILQELAELKSAAVDFLHPERPVSVDPACCGRNYFGRASAVEQEDDELADEREIILEEMAELKQGAVDYMHPERPLPSVDPVAFGRNYFERADSVDSDEDAEERARVLAEAAALKKLAVDFAHPEMPVATSDATVFGRNYFSRPSAPEGETEEEAEERALALADAQALKKTATAFAHPESPVEADATACARSYFSRASAPEQESVEEAEERALVLAEAKALKKLASDYLHPEAPVETTDPTACGRNYFTRASARGVAEHIYSEGFENPTESCVVQHQEEYGHFDMDEDIFYDMRQSIVLPLASEVNPAAAKIQSSKISSEEEGELSRSPSSVMLFTGLLDDDNHPPLPMMG